MAILGNENQTASEPPAWLPLAKWMGIVGIGVPAMLFAYSILTAPPGWSINWSSGWNVLGAVVFLAGMSCTILWFANKDA